MYPMPRKRSGKPRGGQPGNRNALKTGIHTAAMRKLRADAWRRILAVAETAALAEALATYRCAGQRVEPSMPENTER
jgi:hypothetical protein